MKGELRTEWLFDLHATVDAVNAYQVGDFGGGMRTIYPVTGGTVDGPRLRGKVMPFGADFMVARADKVNVLDVRAVIRTEDGADIYAFYPGLLHQDSLGPLAKTPADGMYFRTTPRFETGAEQYRWLNRILAVGVGWIDQPGTVSYKVYAVL